MTTLCEPELQTPNLELRTANPEQNFTTEAQRTQRMRPNRRWTQIYADFGLTFEYAIDQWETPSTDVADR